MKGSSASFFFSSAGVVGREVDLGFEERAVGIIGPKTSLNDEVEEADFLDEEQRVLRSEAAWARREGLKREKGEEGPQERVV